jgi:C-terminal processing protease CtpA/Prc
MVVNVASNEVTVLPEARMEEGVADGNFPLAVATLETTSGSNRSLPVAVACAELVETASTPAVISDLLDRPDLLSATVCKQPRNAKVGISLIDSEGLGVIIGSLDPEGLFAAAPFERGDRVMSVNSENCEDLDAAGVARIIKDAVNMVTLVVRAPNGRADLVSSMIRKKWPTELVGVALKRRRGKIVIASIAEDRMFAHSLLNVGDRVLFINSIKMTPDIDAAMAAALIQASPDFVTIRTKKMELVW